MSGVESQQQPAAIQGAATAMGLEHEGYLDKESKNSKWNRRYFVLEHTCLRYYKDNPEKLPEEERQSRGEIRLKRILNIDITTAKDHRSCLEIQTASGPIYLAAYSDEEREKWIEQIRLACRRFTMQPSLSESGVNAMGALRLDDAAAGPQGGGAGGKSDTSGMKTRVVGGVVMRMPMKSEGDASGRPAESRTSDTDVASHVDRVMSVGSGAAAASAPPQPITGAGSGTLAGGHRKDGGRVLKSGYCVKQGHVRKNWKKRFFLLDPFGFAYYQNESEKEPIKNIPIHDILAVAECTSFSSKNHVFQLVTNGCIYYIQAPTNLDMQQWVAAVEGELQGVVKTNERGSRRSMKI